MGRFARFMFSACAAVSVLICVACVAMWVRSYRTADAWGWAWTKGAVQAGTAHGRLRVSELRLLDESRYGPPWFQHVSYPARMDPPTGRLPARLSNLGFGYERTHVARNHDARVVLVPLWVIFVATAALPGRWVVLQRRRARERRAGHVPCPKCGYDLRATPERCPECGTAMTARSSSRA
jgi:hypothetical protein